MPASRLPWRAACASVTLTPKNGGARSTGRTEESRWKLDGCSDLPHKPLKSIGDVSELLEETINRIRQGRFDLRAANAIGFLAGTLLKALDQRLEKRLALLEAVISCKGKTETEVFEFRPAKESDT